jgi:putative ABC transport system permease protein
MRLFFRFIVRPLKQEPVRALLTLFAVALGVAVVLAIDLAGDAAAGSFRSSVETLAGDADLEVTAVGGLDESVAGTLATLPFAIRQKPRIEDYATLESGEVVPLIGVDLVADALENLDADRGNDTEAFRERETVWVSEDFGYQPGARVRFQVQDKTYDVPVGGVFRQKGKVLVTDIPFAQQILRRPGKLDRVLIWTPESPALEEWIARLEKVLPQGATVSRQGARTRENQRMLEAFRWNLRVLSYIALVVGAFLIYNTISVSVVRRRAEVGILRAIGASRGWVLRAFLGEAALFGIVGGLLGVLLGRFLAEGAVKLVGATVESLYVSSQPGEITVTAASAALALAVGTGVSIVSALSPAHEASTVSPVEAMARGRAEYLSRVNKGWSLAWAGLTALLAAAASRLDPIAGKPIGGYASALLLIGAAALAMPAFIHAVNHASSALLQRVFGVEAMLASRSLSGSLRRTSVLVGALTTAIAMMVSVGIMVGSFRQTVLIWMDNQLRADLYLRPAGPASADRFPTMDASIPDRISALPEVAAVDRFRAYPISYNGLPVTLAGGDSAVTAGDERPSFVSGDRQAVLARLATCDCVIVSEPFASKHKVQVGDMLNLPIGRFEVLGIYYDYASERGYIVMDRATLLKHLPDPAPSNLAIWVKPGVDLERAKQAVERAAAGFNIAVFANRSLRTEAIKIFDRTFAITYALEAVAVIVAVMGVAGALLALVIDRRRELGLLRFLGAAAGQIRRIVLSEAGLLGLLASAAGMVLGWLLSLVLVFVINKQSFGWTIQFHWPVAVLLGALTLVYTATLLAGLYPARIAERLNPIEVIHEE